MPGTQPTVMQEHVEAYADATEEFVRELRDEEAQLGGVLATVLFTDIVGSTARQAELGDRRWAELVQDHHSVVRGCLARYRGRELDTAGDGFFAAFDGPARGIRCAQAITGRDDSDVQVRAGVHTGECEMRGDDIAGIAVHIGARVGAVAGPGEVLVTRLWEERRLAYPIKGQRKGTYWLYYFRGPTSMLTALNRQWEIHDGVLRHLTLKVHPHIVDAVIEHAKAGPTQHAPAAPAHAGAAGPRMPAVEVPEDAGN